MKTNSDSASKGAQTARKTAYTLAAGAAAGMTGSADAATFTDISVFWSGVRDYPVNQFGALDLDVDVDGDGDVLLQNYVFGGGNYQGISVNYFPGQVVGFTTGLTYASNLGEGDLIDYSTVGPSFLGGLAYANNPDSQFDTAPGPVTGFVGFSFPDGPDLHFGWARITIDNAAGTFVLNEWAYETTPGESIVAGEITPEPTSLGLLAAGSLGLASLRSRRRAA